MALAGVFLLRLATRHGSVAQRGEIAVRRGLWLVATAAVAYWVVNLVVAQSTT